MKKWECTVCGYIHEGEEPPEECPVCGADRSKFIEITEKTEDAAEAPVLENPSEDAPEKSKEVPTDQMESFQMGSTSDEGEDVKDCAIDDPPVNEAKKQPVQMIDELLEKYKDITDKMAKYHAHPISVHIPNGVLPVSVFFLFLGLLFGSVGLEAAAFYNLVFVVLAMPLVFLTGYIDWRTRFNGALTQVFKTKMICAAVVFGLGVALMFWRLIDPNVAAPESGARWIFFLFELIMLSAAGVAGYMGGKLVFKK